MCNSIDSIITELDNQNKYRFADQDYIKKMMHEIPDTIQVPREDFILAKCEGKTVLDIGCAGSKLHQELEQVAKEVWGIDKEDCNSKNFFKCDLDNDPLPFPIEGKFEVIVVGETLEHLANPGNFLKKLGVSDALIIITVPNAFGMFGYNNVKLGTENVNKDHVAYYSYHTLKVLVSRYKYQVLEHYWYNSGRQNIPNPILSEGLIFVIRR